ncbi:TadE/TadG family type IV pilus assembly protein [Roseivivax sp. CAU 1753]
MKYDLLNSARHFWQKEDGTSVVPFALWMPVFLTLILSGLELSALTVRHTALEKALDQTVRDVRLGTGTNYDHASLKLSICERAAILPNCLQTLRLEMVKLDLRDWITPPDVVQCVDTVEQVLPVVEFEYGRDNELMFLRACYKFQPFSPTTAFSESLVKDANGYSAIVSTAAFVQEPS